MDTKVTTTENKSNAMVSASLVSNLVLNGDLSKMDDVQKVEYYNWLCHSLNLNPATKPFQLLNLSGKQILYATKDASEQLRKIHGVSVVDSITEIREGLCITKIKVQDSSGRFDVSTGIVPVENLKPADKANAIMKAETKAKRRATLSICGLGVLDESELDTMPEYYSSEITATTVTADPNATNGANGKDEARAKKVKEYSEILEKATTKIELAKIVSEIPVEFKTEKFNAYVSGLDAKLPEGEKIEEAELINEPAKEKNIYVIYSNSIGEKTTVEELKELELQIKANENIGLKDEADLLKILSARIKKLGVKK